MLLHRPVWIVVCDQVTVQSLGSGRLLLREKSPVQVRDVRSGVSLLEVLCKSRRREDIIQLNGDAESISTWLPRLGINMDEEVRSG
jgi:hypothetical protein